MAEIHIRDNIPRIRLSAPLYDLGMGSCHLYDVDLGDHLYFDMAYKGCMLQMHLHTDLNGPSLTVRHLVLQNMEGYESYESRETLWRGTPDGFVAELMKYFSPQPEALTSCEHASWYEEGKRQGFRNGYKVGFSDGFEEGYEQGLNYMENQDG